MWLVRIDYFCLERVRVGTKHQGKRNMALSKESNGNNRPYSIVPWWRKEFLCIFKGKVGAQVGGLDRDFFQFNSRRKVCLEDLFHANGAQIMFMVAIKMCYKNILAFIQSAFYNIFRMWHILLSYKPILFYCLTEMQVKILAVQLCFIGIINPI